MALPLLLIPIGGFFENTLGECSLFSAEVLPPGGGALGFEEDWINVARDFQVVGDGSDETAKIQAALDAAASGSLGRSKVLIPGGLTVTVAPIEDDLCTGSFFGPVGVCLWADTGVTLRCDATLRVDPTAALAYPNDFITVIETRNSFVGSSATRDETFHLEGNGTIDLEGIYSGGVFTEDTAVTKQTKNIWALRSYKGDKVTVKGITIKHGIGHKLVHGFGSHIEIVDVKFHKALKYESNTAPIQLDTALIVLDVCNGVRVNGCIARECAVFSGVASWATKELLVTENNFSDLYSGDGSAEVDATGSGVTFVDYGMEFAELTMDGDAEIYDLAEGMDARMTISTNIFCRNRYGVKIFGGSWNGSLTMGVFIVDNKLCSNAHIGLYYQGLKDYLFESNQIENDGWDWPLSFD